MGRKSRQKRERRETGLGPVARVAQGRSRASLLALLEAASVSPNASQYLPSLAVIYESIAKRTRVGHSHADETLLPSLIKAAHQECPSLTTTEDFLPHDPRLDVRVEWSGQMFRIVAGTLERPTSDIETLRRLSATVDSVLDRKLGYRLTDLIELILRRVDAVSRRLAPAWAADMEQQLRSPPRITSDEFSAALKLPPFEDQVTSCIDPKRARLGIRANSVPTNRLECDANSLVATFGSTIAIRYGQNGFTPLPVGLMVEALNSLAGEYALKSLAFESSLDKRWQDEARRFVGAMFVSSGNEVIGTLLDDQCLPLHSVIRYNDTQHLVVGVVAGLDNGQLDMKIAEAARLLGGVTSGSMLKTKQGPRYIPDTAMLARLLIVVAPQAIALIHPTTPTCAMVTLQDLDWIRRTIGRDEIDLWYFARDMVERKNVGEILSLSGLDMWELWRDQDKSFHRGGRKLDLLCVDPHHSVLEWQKMSEQREVEQALYLLKMDRICNWPIHNIEDNSNIIGDACLRILYDIVVGPTPVAVSLLSPPEVESQFGSRSYLGECVAHKLRCSQNQFTSLMRSSGRSSLRIEFVVGNAPQQRPLWVEQFKDNVLTIGWGLNLPEHLRKDSRSVESLIGSLLAEAIATESDIEEFIAAWDGAPPGIRFDAITVAPRIPYTPQPVPLHGSHRSKSLAELGVHLEDSGVVPSSYRGDDAKQIETDRVFPWFISKLHENLSRFDETAILAYALRQLEYTNCHRWWTNEKDLYPVGSSNRDDDHTLGPHQDLFLQARDIGLLIEEVFAHPPTGSAKPTAYDWQEVLSLAQLARESSERSEALHRRLTKHELEVSDLYQVNIVDAGHKVSFNASAFAKDFRLARLPTPVPIDTSAGDSNPRQDWSPISVRCPEYIEIDECLQESFKFGLDAILGIFQTIAQWNVLTPDHMERASRDDIAREAHFVQPQVSLNEFELAVKWLSLRREDIGSPVSTIEHWEVEARSARLATRPLLCTNNLVWILPWTAVLAERIWVTYLRQHRIPIRDSELPGSIAAVFGTSRQRRQRAFEKECKSQLDGLGLITVSGVRKERAHRHGIKDLSGEIDLLCLDATRSIIFVIEAKDPFVPFSARSIDRQLTLFHKRGGYVDVLTTKVTDMHMSSVSFAENKKVTDAARDWQVVGVMVTRHLSPAAYVKNGCSITFCTVETLRTVVEGYAS